MTRPSAQATAAAAFAIVLLGTLASPGTGQARQATPLPTVDPADYGRWESLGRTVLSPRGDWAAYEVTRVDETRELRLSPTVEGDSTRAFRDGERPVFSPDGRWLAWSVVPSPEERERLEEAGEAVRNGVTLLELATGEERSFEAVRSLAFDAEAGHLALHGYPPEEPEGRGGDLRVVELATGTETNLGSAAEMRWSPAGSLLAFVVAPGGGADGAVQTLDAATGRLRSLDTSPSSYRHLAWGEDDAHDLAVLRSVDEGGDAAAEHRLLAWRETGGPAPVRLELDPADHGLPDSLGVVGHAPPRWSGDGSMIAVGLRPLEPDDAEGTGEGDAASPAEGDEDEPADEDDPDDVGEGDDGDEGDEPELPGVQIWHSKDVRIVPMQTSREAFTSRATLPAVWRVEDDRLIRVGTQVAAPTQLLGPEDGPWLRGVERIDEAYPWGTMFGRPYHDVHVVDLGDQGDPAGGGRTVVAERVRYSWGSPGGRWLVTFDGRDYRAHDLEDGQVVDLTGGLPAAFADTAYDTPTDVLPPHGIGGWYEDDRAVLLYDEFDVWRVALDGSGGERLTRGAEEEIVHRVQRVGEDGPLDPDAPLHLSLRGEWTERQGYARVDPDGGVRRLAWEDRAFRGLQKADSADVFAFRKEARHVSPDVWVGGPELGDARRVSRTNPFLLDYAWTRAELVAYTSEAGIRLHGSLLYPADHDPSRRYPMIVYAYELLTPQHHSWEGPSERDYYNFTAWTQAGYFVLLPDIVFRARDPGVSTLEALRPAVGAVVERGLVDPERVGFIGHSWGGYEATYVATHSDLFAASVAGAALTDFLSVMGQIHWNGGLPETGHWETGQARMEVPFWEDPEAHRRNSPVHRVHEMETPLLMAHGDEDGVVEFWQATEFYNFARRAEKQVVLLVYEGEDHGFREEANQKDYHRRILEWFGHYLKGEPAPTWITEGVPLDVLEEEKKRVAGSG